MRLPPQTQLCWKLIVLLGSEQMLERGHKDWEGSWGRRMAQEGSGDIRERKDAAAEMVNATVKFRKMMQTLIKDFSRFNCEMLDKISSSYGSKTLEKNLQPSSKFNPKNVWVIHLYILVLLNSQSRNQEHFKKVTPFSTEEQDERIHQRQNKSSTWWNSHLNYWSRENVIL